MRVILGVDALVAAERDCKAGRGGGQGQGRGQHCCVFSGPGHVHQCSACAAMRLSQPRAGWPLRWLPRLPLRISWVALVQSEIPLLARPPLTCLSVGALVAHKLAVDTGGAGGSAHEAAAAVLRAGTQGGWVVGPAGGSREKSWPASPGCVLLRRVAPCPALQGGSSRRRLCGSAALWLCTVNPTGRASYSSASPPSR